MSNFKRLVLDYIYENKSFLSLYLIVVLFTWPAEAIILSKLYGMLVEAIKQKISMNEIFNFSSNIKKENVFGILTLIVIVWVFIIAFYRIKFALEQKLIPEYIKYLRNLFIHGVLNNSSENMKDIRSGEYLSKIIELSNIFQQNLQALANTFLPFFMGIISISVYYFFIDFNLGLLSAILCIIRIYFNVADGITYSQVAAKRDSFFFNMVEKINDSFNNVMNIHLNNQLKNEKKKTNKRHEEYNKLYEKEIQTRSELAIKRNIYTVACFIILTIFACYLYKKNKISFVILLTIVMIEIKIIGRFIHFDETSLHFFSKLGTIMSSKSFLDKVLKNVKSTDKNCKIKNNSIIINDLVYKYDAKSDPIFNKLNLNIPSGQRAALVGTSGSGKSTLMKLLVKLHKPTSGTIKIGNCNIEDINTEYLRDKITYVNQRTTLFNDTIINNIKYGNKSASDSEIQNFIDKYKLDKIYSKLNNGIQTNAGVNGSKLSLGMQKITIILRGLFRNSDIVIFDEPLAGLDKETKEKVIDVINDIPKETTVLIVTHDPEILSHMDVVYPLKELHG
jgi:ABC-type multidrug transport system fused ATPase/permease subunit